MRVYHVVAADHLLVLDRFTGSVVDVREVVGVDGESDLRFEFAGDVLSGGLTEFYPAGRELPLAGWPDVLDEDQGSPSTAAALPPGVGLENTCSSHDSHR